MEAIGGGNYRVRARVVNHGPFPTNISNRGSQLNYHRPVRVEVELPEGVKLLSTEGHKDLGHLAGLTGNRLLEWFVNAPDNAKELLRLHVFGWTGGNFTRTIEITSIAK